MNTALDNVSAGHPPILIRVHSPNPKRRSHFGQIRHDAPARRDRPVAIEIVSEDVIEPDSFGYSRDLKDTPDECG